MRPSDDIPWAERRRRKIGVLPQLGPEHNVDTVPFVAFACPICRGRPDTYGVDRVQGVRYHHCRPCAYSYRSIEVAPDQVRGFEGDRALRGPGA